MIRYITFLFAFLLIGAGPGWAQDTKHEEHVLWECLVTGYTPNVNYAGHGSYHLKIQRLSYMRDGAVVWTRQAPESVKKLTDLYVMGKESELKTGDVIREVGMGTHPFYLIDFYVCTDVFLKTTIGISCKAGFLLLKKSDGDLLIDQPYPFFEEESDGYFTPETDIVINVKKLSCSFTSHCRHGEFTGRCGDYLFHHNGQVLFVFDKKNRLMHTQKGEVKLTPDRKFTTFAHEKYTVLFDARKRILEN